VAAAGAFWPSAPPPARAYTVQAAVDQSISTPAPKQESASQAPGSDLFSAFFKASTSQVASGRAGEPPANYLESMEAIYRRRGYRRFEPAAVGGGASQSLEKVRRHRPNQMGGKIYWLTRAGA